MKEVIFICAYETYKSPYTTFLGSCSTPTRRTQGGVSIETPTRRPRGEEMRSSRQRRAARDTPTRRTLERMVPGRSPVVSVRHFFMINLNVYSIASVAVRCVM